MPKSFAIVCDANEEVGFGHFMRCFALAKAMASLGTDAHWYGDIDELLIEQYQLSDVHSHTSTLAALSTALKQCEFVLLDSYRVNEQTCQGMVEHGQLIVIDDFGNDSWRCALAVINFTVNAPHLTYLARHQFLGPKYFLVNPQLVAIKNRLPRQITIMLGGSDTQQFGPKLADALVLAGMKNVHLIGRYEVVHPAYQHTAFTNQMHSIYANTQLLISGGGLAKYEAAYLKIPNIVLAQNQLQASESHHFDRLNLSYCYGLQEQINVTEFASWLTTFDDARQKHQFASDSPFAQHSTLNVATRLARLFADPLSHLEQESIENEV